jgi:hypothetical protein
MYAHLTSRRTSPGAGANALVKPRRRLDVETGDEMKQSLPSDWQLGQLKQSKQLLKAESAEIEAIPMTVHRAWLERRAH